MNTINFDFELINALKVMWDYLSLNMPLEKADLIIGCGCRNLKIPKRCAELYSQNYGKNILFCGGYGKLTGDFLKPEAEIFKDIAIESGVPKNKIFVESKSTNTGDNFKFSLEIIEKNNLKFDKILIVHNTLSARRTLNCAKAVIPNKDIRITGINNTFERFIESLKNMNTENAINNISVIVGDIQRIIIFPQFGWQVEDEVPEEVIKNYNILKKRGFNKYIFSEKSIQKMIDENGLVDGKTANYFQ